MSFEKSNDLVGVGETKPDSATKLLDHMKQNPDVWQYVSLWQIHEKEARSLLEGNRAGQPVGQDEIMDWTYKFLLNSELLKGKYGDKHKTLLDGVYKLRKEANGIFS
jgi:hypothetical protein